MYCMNCGALVPDTAVFCPSCGASLKGAQAAPAHTQPVSAAKKRVNWITILLGVLVIGLAVALGVVLLEKKSDDPTQQTEPSSQQAAIFTQEAATAQESEASENTTVSQETASSPAPTEALPTAAETAPTETAAAVSQEYGHGLTTFKEVVCSYTQTDEGQIELRFENKGPYDLTLYSSSGGGMGFTVIGTDEHGNKISTQITGVWSIQGVPSYSAPKVYTAAFEGLSGKIVEVRINGVAYTNTEKQFDFGNSQQIVIPGE